MESGFPWSILRRRSDLQKKSQPTSAMHRYSVSLRPETLVSRASVIYLSDCVRLQTSSFKLWDFDEPHSNYMELFPVDSSEQFSEILLGERWWFHYQHCSDWTWAHLHSSVYRLFNIHCRLRRSFGGCFRRCLQASTWSGAPLSGMNTRKYWALNIDHKLYIYLWILQ